MGASRFAELPSVQGQLWGRVSTWRLVEAFAGGGARVVPQGGCWGVSQARALPLEPLRHPQSCRDEMTLPVQKGPFCDIFTQVQPSCCCPLAERVPKSQLPCLQACPAEGSVITALRQDRSCACQRCGGYTKPAWGWHSSRLSAVLGWTGLVWTWPSVTVPLLDHLGPLSSDLPPSPALPCRLPLGLGQCWSQPVLVHGFRSSRPVFQILC